MVRPTVLTKLCVWIVLMLPMAVAGQGHEISGESSLSGSVTLTLFDGDSSSHTHTARIDRGLFLFSGTVKGPVLASLTHPSMRSPLYFYLENSAIAITLNASRPEVSLIKGSRSNSEYRYVMERYRSDADPNIFLREYVQDNPSSIYAPFILYSQMQQVDEGVLRQLIGKLTGAAVHTYHYTLLRRWQRETPSVSEGSDMPDFTFADSKRKQVKFSEVRDTAGATLVVVGASWCDRCGQMAARANRLVKDRAVSVLYIRIDDSPAGWDAPFLRQLSVDHLPYAILVGADGRVLARDIRGWELDGIIRSF